MDELIQAVNDLELEGKEEHDGTKIDLARLLKAVIKLYQDKGIEYLIRLPGVRGLITKARSVCDNCDGGIQACDTAYLYELYRESDGKWNEEGNNSCMISARIYPRDFVRLVSEYVEKNPDDFNIEGFLDYLDCQGVWTRIIAPDHSIYFGKGEKLKAANTKCAGSIKD